MSVSELEESSDSSSNCCEPIERVPHIRKLYSECFEMKPNFVASRLNESERVRSDFDFGKFRRKVEKSRKLPSSQFEPPGEDIGKTRGADIEKIKTLFTSIKQDSSSVSGKLDDLYDYFVTLLSRVECLEKRLVAVESRESSGSSVARIEKLEYRDSERARLDRATEITVTHPTLQAETTTAENLLDLLNTKLSCALRKPAVAHLRPIGPSSPSTVLVSLSDIRFKRELFAAKNRLRRGGSDLGELYINEHLTSQNYEILKQLKKIRRDREEAGSGSNFFSVYSFNGRVYIKIEREGDPVPVRAISEIPSVVSRLQAQ